MSGTTLPRPSNPLIEASKLDSQEGPLKVYKLDVEKKQSKSEVARECIVKAGNQVQGQYCPEKNILLVGQSGSGKSTMIDAMVNYIVGVRREDPFRFKLIDLTEKEKGKSSEQSQTEWITCYTIPQMYGTDIPFTVKLVDTPGNLSTEGTKTDEQHAQNIRTFFSEDSALFLDAVCFLVKASDSKLTATQETIFNGMLEAFGNDVRQNIFVFVTHCDGDSPAALKTLQAAGVPFQHHHCVNNVSLYKANACDYYDPNPMSKLFWEMTESSMRKFFHEDLQSLLPCSIALTQKVCQNRLVLEERLDGIKRRVDEHLKKSEQRVELKKQLGDLTVIKIVVKESHPVKVPIPRGGRRPTNCKTCSATCHKKCWAFTDFLAHRCKMMDSSGSCTICKHPAADHESSEYHFEMREKEVQKTRAELKEDYVVEGEKTADLIDATDKDITQSDSEQMDRLKDIQVIIEELNKIALHPIHSDELGYIRSAIEKETEEQKEGWQARVRGFNRLEERYKRQSYCGSHTSSNAIAGQRDDDFTRGSEQRNDDLPTGVEQRDDDLTRGAESSS